MKFDEQEKDLIDTFMVWTPFDVIGLKLLCNPHMYTNMYVIDAIRISRHFGLFHNNSVLYS